MVYYAGRPSNALHAARLAQEAHPNWPMAKQLKITNPSSPDALPSRGLHQLNHTSSSPTSPTSSTGTNAVKGISAHSNASAIKPARASRQSMDPPASSEDNGPGYNLRLRRRVSQEVIPSLSQKKTHKRKRQIESSPNKVIKRPRSKSSFVDTIDLLIQTVDRLPVAADFPEELLILPDVIKVRFAVTMTVFHRLNHHSIAARLLESRSYIR